MLRRHLLRQLPAWAAAGLCVSALPARAVLDTAALEKAAAAADLHSLMVWQRGELLMQHHRRSRDRPGGSWFEREVDFGPDVLHDMRSISKSVIGLLVGQAVGRGEVDIGAPVLDHFPELQALRSGPQQAITVTHLLNMTAGLSWNEEIGTYGRAANDETRLASDPAPWGYVLDRALAHPPGQVWQYNGGCTALLAEIVQRRSGRPWLDRVREDLFSPLGIQRFAWRTGAHGQPMAYAGLRLSAADLLLLGRLMLDGGRWQGRQLVPAAWVAATLQGQATVGRGSLQYSQQWWNGTVLHQGRTLSTTAGMGNGGQRLFVVPALGLLVVFTAGQYNSSAIGPLQAMLLRQIVGMV